MEDISISVGVLGLVGLVVAASQNGQEVKLPVGIKVKLDADSATLH